MVWTQTIEWEKRKSSTVGLSFSLTDTVPFVSVVDPVSVLGSMLRLRLMLSSALLLLLLLCVSRALSIGGRGEVNRREDHAGAIIGRLRRKHGQHPHQQRPRQRRERAGRTQWPGEDTLEMIPTLELYIGPEQVRLLDLSFPWCAKIVIFRLDKICYDHTSIYPSIHPSMIMMLTGVRCLRCLQRRHPQGRQSHVQHDHSCRSAQAAPIGGKDGQH